MFDVPMWVVIQVHVWLTPHNVKKVYGPYFNRKEAVHVKNELMEGRNHYGDVISYQVRKVSASKWDNFNN